METIRNIAAARLLTPGTLIEIPRTGETVLVVSEYDRVHDWYTCHEVDFNESGDGMETERITHLTASDLAGGVICSTGCDYIKPESPYHDIDREYEIVAHVDRSRPGVKWLDEGWLVRYNNTVYFVATDTDITDAYFWDWSSIDNKWLTEELDPADGCTYYYFGTSKEVTEK